jgi:hypothetical protein
MRKPAFSAATFAATPSATADDKAAFATAFAAYVTSGFDARYLTPTFRAAARQVFGDLPGPVGDLAQLRDLDTQVRFLEWTVQLFSEGSGARGWSDVLRVLQRWVQESRMIDHLSEALPSRVSQARARRRRPFDAAMFTAMRWESAEEKARFANQFVTFVRSGFARSAFPTWFYRRLSMTFGHIAHYNIDGFYGTFFRTPTDRRTFIEHTLSWQPVGDPHFTDSDVERAIQQWMRVEAQEAPTRGAVVAAPTAR